MLPAQTLGASLQPDNADALMQPGARLAQGEHGAAVTPSSQHPVSSWLLFTASWSALSLLLCGILISSLACACRLIDSADSAGDSPRKRRRSSRSLHGRSSQALKLLGLDLTRVSQLDLHPSVGEDSEVGVGLMLEAAGSRWGDGSAAGGAGGVPKKSVLGSHATDELTGEAEVSEGEGETEGATLNTRLLRLEDDVLSLGKEDDDASDDGDDAAGSLPCLAARAKAVSCEEHEGACCAGMAAASRPRDACQTSLSPRYVHTSDSSRSQLFRRPLPLDPDGIEAALRTFARCSSPLTTSPHLGPYPPGTPLPTGSESDTDSEGGTEVMATATAKKAVPKPAQLD